MTKVDMLSLGIHVFTMVLILVDMYYGFLKQGIFLMIDDLIGEELKMRGPERL